MTSMKPSSGTIRHAALWPSLCLLSLLSACASPRPPTVVSEVETITLTKEVLVPVPAGLTEQVEIPRLPANPDTIALAAAYRATVIRLLIANGRLREISELQP